MYVRDAKNRDEVWLLDHIEEMGLDDAAFRSRDYVIALDEETGERAGFGRIRIHKADAGDYCEFTGIGVLAAWRGQGVGAHVLERLVDKARHDEFDVVYSLTAEPNYLVRFEFEPVEVSGLPSVMRDRLDEKRASVDEDTVAMQLTVDDFSMPGHLREAFKEAKPHHETATEPEESAEDFGIDPDSATYKYDTGG